MDMRTITMASMLFASGISAGHAAQQAGPSDYRGKDDREAALALIEVAKVQAGKGSWERIAVGRIYYLGGMKPQGKAIFDEVLAHDPESSDLFRIARIYRQAGEWEAAKALLERSVRENPKDSKGMAELGAYHLLAGDRAAAEDLFDRSFKRDDELWSTVAAAGAYLGVAPQE